MQIIFPARAECDTLTELMTSQHLAQRVAGIASQQLGVPLWLRDYPAQAEGDVSYTVVGAERAGLWRAIATVTDLGAVRSAAVMGERNGCAALVGYRIDDESLLQTCADAMADHLRSGQIDRIQINALDAAFGLLDALNQTLAVPGGRWRPLGWGEWDESSTGVSVELGGAGEMEWNHLVTVTQTNQGVTVRVPGDEMSAPVRVHDPQSLRDFVAQLPAIIEEVRGTVDGRAAFRARPLSVFIVGEQVRKAIQHARAVHGRLESRCTDPQGFPQGYPSAEIWRVDRLGEHLCAQLEESKRGVRVIALGLDVTLADVEQLEAALPRIVEAVREQEARLSMDQLEPGRVYEVTAPFEWGGHKFSPGTALCFEKATYVPHESYYVYSFRGASPGAPNLTLCEISDDDLAIIRRVHELLRRRDPA